MKNKYAVLYLALIVIVLFGIYITLNIKNIDFPSNDVQIACTMDAKMCPDGSYVGRTGPKCEFVCPDLKPNINEFVGVNSSVTLSGIEVMPIQIIQDSRCQKDVQCIWAGTVVVKTRFIKNNVQKELDVELASPVQVFDKQVTLYKVMPEKVSDNISKKQYVLYYSVKNI